MRIIFSSFIFFSYFLIFHIFHLISSFAPHLIATSSSSCSSRVLSERTKKSKQCGKKQVLDPAAATHCALG